MTTVPRILASLAPLALLLACGTESDRGITGALTPSGPSFDVANYSDWSAPVNLGPPVNTTFLEQGVSISKEGLSLYFQSDRPGGFGGSDIWVSQRACLDCPWGDPVNLGENINTSSSEGAARVTIDGHRLYFNSGRPGGFGGNDLYVSRRPDKRDDFGWRPPENLGSGVNTSALEMQAAPFEDDATGTTTLYFASNRAGGPGPGADNDIYASTLQPDETFGPAVLVPELSTAFTDQQPAIRRDGLEIFLASDRPGTLGLNDLWVATRASTADAWSTPVNLGNVVNTAFLDARPALSFDATHLYFQSPRPGGLGSFDLYLITRSKLTGPD